MKVCSNCKIEKEIASFTKNSSRKDGLKINCIECCKILYNKYRDANKIKESERGKRYNKEKRVINKEEVKKYKSKYYKDNKDIIEYKKKKYRESNKEHLNETRKRNIIKYLNERIGSSIRASLKSKEFKKKLRTYEILGCHPLDFKLYIESKFETWMTWENWGKYNGELYYGWDLDHIIPSSSAITENDILKLNHYTNFQPLDSLINRFVKKDRLDYKKS